MLLFALVLASLLAAPDLPSQRAALLAKSPPAEADFRALVEEATREMARRNLPTFAASPENIYLPEHVAFRAEVYGPLVAQPAAHELLRALARKAGNGGFDFTATTAAIVLADAPDDGDLQALLDGYVAAPPDDRSSIARQLGRAIGARRGDPAAAPLVAPLLERLRADAAAGKPSARGAALEALFRAGEVDEVVRVLRPLLADGADPLEAITLVSACSRLFQRADIDPFLRARGVAAGRATIERLLASDAAVTTTGLIAGDGRALRSAIAFLQGLGGDAEFALLVRCLVEPRGVKLLGMDGLQNLRFALQSKRAKVAPALGEALDGHYLALLTGPATRLFALAEEPMEQDEQRAFWDARDLRYNALSYLVDQFGRTPAVKARLEREADLPALLATFVAAKSDAKESGGGGAPLYSAVAEKLENRILALELLALVQREWNRDPGGLDLFAEAYAILCGEVQAPLLPFGEIVAFREAREPGRVLELLIGRVPADAWVQNAACQTIADLGYVLNTSPRSIRIEVDTKNPWPWPAKGSDAKAADGK